MKTTRDGARIRRQHNGLIMASKLNKQSHRDRPQNAMCIRNWIGPLRSVIVCYFVSMLLFLLDPGPLTGQQIEIDAAFYRSKVQPILADKCYTCHGPDAQTREGGFRFDQKESAFGEADSGQRPIVPSDAESSELLNRIHATDDSQMPPADQEKQLKDSEKKILAQWIRAGAPWQNHWAFSAPKSIAVPQPQQLGEPRLTAWFQNPIDAFVLEKIGEQNLVPSPRANKTTLIRRVTFDLTGLPPSPQEVRDFLADESPNAYEKVVDRLLNSPHYGEHLASSWLDAARFADTNGYQNDFARNMWPWRDWVIQAFNDNMPFDQFTIEQLAGDLLPDPTVNQKIATGFNRNNRSVTEGGSIEAEWHVENVVDRVETTATVFLGLTMGCARCHDHKYDPISQEEFYEFFAYFNNTADKGMYNEKRGNFGPMLRVATPAAKQRIRNLETEISKFKSELAALDKTLSSRQTKWEQTFAKSEIMEPADVSESILASVKHANQPESLDQAFENALERLGALESRPRLQPSPLHGPKYTDKESRQALRLSGAPDTHLELGSHFEIDGEQPFSISVWVNPEKFGAILSRMDEPNAYRGFDLLMTKSGQLSVHLIHQWPNNAIKVTTRKTLQRNRWSHVAVTYDGSRKAAGLAIWIDGQSAKLDINNDNLTGTTVTKHPFWIGNRAYTDRLAGQLTDIRLYRRNLSNSEIEQVFHRPINSIVKLNAETRTEAQSQLLSQKFRNRFSVKDSKIREQLGNAESELKRFRDSLPTTMIMQELAKPRKTYRLNRGQYDQPDKSKELQPNVPVFLPRPDPAQPRNRLGLAQWIVASENPLTARVTVNRFWQNLFGRGLVETADNFGVQSPLPTHPKLLDWLAVDFVKSGWDVKRLHKQMVMSQTYCQSSKVDADSLNADPTNKWLARGSRFRLSAEMIRDNALSVSGLLTQTIGGPSMKPYQPAGVWKELAGGAGEKPYVQATDENLYRRSLYIYRKRTVPHPTMSTFDAGSREICQVARQRTNTPLQALALLNDVTYVEAARVLAVSGMEADDDVDNRIRNIFFRALSREPTPDELSVLTNAFERYSTHFAQQTEAARKLLEFGESAAPSEIDQAKLAALTMVCSTILNLDEAITRE